ncbi:MBL fold metallo-hydrolase [Actinomadura logoneensis]|uniref:MBL fold metallo-hydrolase n=1 Tax=Actinomadura logoneensis TaxID=2293572 RepID=A0A372JIK6_9ACTN|nr:MBL fold metallo-hydrolase [Actinomadura logoneensis]RFU39694.1 MBL fold metallo-hydrolase [Actinomadura logoneensis]
MTVPYRRGLHELAAGTHAYLQPDGSWGWSNAGLVVSGGDALLVDTLFDHPLTRAMLGEIARALPDVRVRTVVNTHSDGDHWWGNRLLAEADPDVEIVASEAAAAVMRGDRTRELLLAPPVEALPRVLARMVTAFDLGGVVPAPPNRTFSGELELGVGERTVRLIEVGPAHTPGDVLVHVPDARVLFTGDILFAGGHPVVHTGPVGRWIDACDLIVSLDADAIVPGHGPIVGKPEVRRFREYLVRLRDHAVRCHEAGVPLADAVRSMDLSGFEHLRDSERLLLNVGAVYRELNGDGTPHEHELLARLDDFTAPADRFPAPAVDVPAPAEEPAVPSAGEPA